MTTEAATITPEKLGQLRAGGQTMEMLDVRTPAEFRELHVSGARNVPLDRLDCDAVIASRKLPADQPLYVICRSGSRGRRRRRRRWRGEPSPDHPTDHHHHDNDDDHHQQGTADRKQRVRTRPGPHPPPAFFVSKPIEKVSVRVPVRRHA